MPIIPNSTLSYIANLVNRADPVIKPLPLSRAKFTLDSSGVAGFFGGESAVRAMSTVNLVPKRRWFGWYNSPGSYEVAKQYSKLANSRVFDALFPGGDSDPAKILMVDGRAGPEHAQLYFPSSRAPEPIGHLGSLIARKISRIPVKKAFPKQAKRTMDARVTFIKLHRMPGELDELELSPSDSNIFAIGTILISIGACVICALITDWFCFASIALGMIANGVSCAVIGSGKPYLKHNPPSQVYAPGDVVLRSETDIIVLFGMEGSVSPFTRARFFLRFGPTPESALEASTATTQCDGCHGRLQIATCSRCQSQHIVPPEANPPKSIPSTPTVSLPQTIQRYLIDISVILLLSQFLAQLLLIPQGTLLGQIMFVGTLIPSWVYHSYLSFLSLDLQTKTLLEQLSIQERYDIYRYQLNTWTEAVVFTCLAFSEIHPDVALAISRSPRAAVPTASASEVMATTGTTGESGASGQAGPAGVGAVTTAGTPGAAGTTGASAVAGAGPGTTSTGTGTTGGGATGVTQNDAEKAAEEVKKAAEDAQKIQAAEKEEAARKEKAAFRKLLNVLLPGKTDVWQAFKDSLARKLGATDDDNQSQFFIDGTKPFGFESRDSYAAHESSSRKVRGNDLKQLETYQKDANNALVAWREVREIAEIIRMNYSR